MPDNVKPYLDYLEKEMTIMGILSAFCVGTLALGLKELLGAAEKSQLANVWSQNGVSLLLATSMMVSAAGFFYWQRSILAWLYGQIALCWSDASISGWSMREWLREADSWRTWIHYRWGLTTMCLGIVGYLTALSSAVVTHPHTDLAAAIYATTIVVACMIMGRLAYLMRKHPFDEDPIALMKVLGIPASAKPNPGRPKRQGD